MTREERYRARREARLRLHDRRGPIRAGDVALTIGLLVVASILLPVVTTLSSLFAGSIDCADAACSQAVAIGGLGGIALPLVVFLAGAVTTVVRLVRHLRGWPAAIVTGAAVVACLPLSIAVALVGSAL